MLYQKLKTLGAIGALCALVAVATGDSQARPIHGGAASGGGSAGNLPAALTVYNTGSTASGQLITLAQPFAQGDVPSGSKVQVYKADGVTTITTQEDGCSTWQQDGSRKSCNISFVNPDSITGSGNLGFKTGAVSGSPSTTPNVTKSNITSNTNFCLKSSDLTEANGTAETGTWDLICLNTVLNTYNQYNGSTGYGSNPVGGWEYYASGPNRLGVHAFQYAIRESDGAIEKWIRTDMYVDFWGSGSTPCPCSFTYNITEPNTFGPISGGTMGPSSEGAYVLSAQEMNGSTTLRSFGGASDTRTLSLPSSDFNASTGHVAFPSGNWSENTGGVFPVKFSGSSLPAGITSSTIAWINADGNTPDDYYLAPFQCTAPPNGCPNYLYPSSSAPNIALQPGNYISVTNPNNDATLYVKLCPTSSCTATTSDIAIAASATNAYIAVGSNTYISGYTTSTEGNGGPIIPRQGFTTAGSGTITATFYIPINPWTGSGLLLDTKGSRIWVDSTGSTVIPAPSILVGHDFTYLTQKTKAIPPYLTTLAGNLLSFATPNTYYPGSYLWGWNPNETGDTPGDERIGPLNHSAIYSIAQPTDANAAQQSAVLAASFGRGHFFHDDETVGLPVTFNNGPSGGGTQYPTLGTLQTSNRTYPYQTGSWLTPNFSGTGIVNLDPIQEVYGNWLDASHLPLPQQAVFLKSGEPEWEDQMVQEANALIGNFQITTATVGSNNYYRAISAGNTVTRGIAWGGRVIDQAYWFLPASSPVAPYFLDLEKDEANFTWDYAQNSTTTNEKALGYHWNDIGDYSLQNDYQNWMGDYAWSFHYAMNAWRNEFSGAKNFTNNYYYKFIIGRMNGALAGPTGPGCLWAASARYNLFYPNNSPVGDAYLFTDWPTYYADNASFSGPTSEWGTWTGCPASGMISDGTPTGGYGTLGSGPVGLVTFMAASAAMGSLLGISTAQTSYTAIRTMQYGNGCPTCTIPLSFTSFADPTYGTKSYPEFGFGYLGATN